jgi:hypothetical protein
MPTKRRRTLGAYIAALVRTLDRADPPAGRRLRAVVGARRARIGLDDETVDVFFVGDRLAARAARASAPRRIVDGSGHSDRATTGELLDGWVEVSEAIIAGDIEATGTVDDVARLFHAVEILLDGATRAPAMQSLAESILSEPRTRRPVPVRTRLDLTTSSLAELALLRRLDLVP